jgi:nucleotide-binding universal stress UspA family protein
MHTHHPSGIVVGIEGTTASQAALDWALREAALRGCTLKVVHAWEYIAARDAGRMTEHEEKTASECMIDAAIATAKRETGLSPTIIERSVKGSPAKVLLIEAESAELLVLGRGHRSGAIDVLRHSVSAECVRRANSPVVVIPNVPTVVQTHPAGH